MMEKQKNTTHSPNWGEEDPIDLQKISKAMSRTSSIYLKILEILHLSTTSLEYRAMVINTNGHAITIGL
jgi:hypothetical protein